MSNATISTVSQQDNSAVSASWTLTTADHTGSAIEFSEWSDKSIHVSGTWGGATCILEGSNDGVDWQGLKNQASTAITFSSSGIMQVLETTRYVRPRLSVAGSGASVSVKLLINRRK